MTGLRPVGWGLAPTAAQGCFCLFLHREPVDKSVESVDNFCERSVVSVTYCNNCKHFVSKSRFWAADGLPQPTDTALRTHFCRGRSLTVPTASWYPPRSGRSGCFWHRRVSGRLETVPYGCVFGISHTRAARWTAPTDAREGPFFSVEMPMWRLWKSSIFSTGRWLYTLVFLRVS